MIELKALKFCFFIFIFYYGLFQSYCPQHRHMECHKSWRLKQFLNILNPQQTSQTKHLQLSSYVLGNKLYNCECNKKIPHREQCILKDKQ